MGSRLEDEGERNGWREQDFETPDDWYLGMPMWWWKASIVIIVVVLYGVTLAGIVYGAWWLIASQ